MSGLMSLLNTYGYPTLFFALMLELICIPIPNEALMSYVGILSFHGKMNYLYSVLAASSGGIVGVSISYWIGYKLGAPFFKKYGRYIHMGPEKMARISRWYSKYGKVLLIFTYFIPGIRHVASIISGVIRLPFRSFALFSYIGVLLWTGTFISLGYVLGPQWDSYQVQIKRWLVLTSIFLAIIVIGYVVIKANWSFIKESLRLIFQSFFKRYKSFLRIKLILVLLLASFVALFTLMIGMIQDFVANEVGPFNHVTRSIVFFLFANRWGSMLSHYNVLSSRSVLAAIFLLTIAIILINRVDRWLELLFYGLTLAGGFLFIIGVRWLFHFMLGTQVISLNFPDRQAFLVVIFYGLLIMAVIRHQRNYRLMAVLFCLLVMLLLVFAVGGIYLSALHPNDLLAGYVFGAVWGSGMILLLELFRFLSLIKKNR
ncbi:MAG: VTT domain-containing protein [Sporolactobacillus sp.]|jgi:membrane protein DedA with SNARE-associated domain|nr:VTT domain-containing protein [Sporolactobacillus sp.]